MLDVSINNAFKVLNNPAMREWHAGMTIHKILDQLSSIYGQATSTAMELNDIMFHGLCIAADAPKVFFCRLEDCDKIAILGQNLYTDHQLINNAIRLLIMTGSYIPASV